MGARRQAREYALCVLFEEEFGALTLFQILARVFKENRLEQVTVDFLNRLVSVYDEKSSIINETLKSLSIHWKLYRMSGVDRNILRLGATEILFFADIPKNVTINEYVEIAKKFGSEDSANFVNGILDKVVVAIEPKTVLDI